MPRSKKPFSLYRRPAKKKGKYFFYVQFRNSDGNYQSGISSGQTSKAAAEAWAIEQLQAGAIPTQHALTFGQFAKDWWGDKCDYVQRRRARGLSISPGYMATMKIYLDLHLLPVFANLKLKTINTAVVERWLISLYEQRKLSPTTINHVLGCFKIMMKEAARLGYLVKNPLTGIEEVKEKRKEKGILLPDEVHLLFQEGSISTVWGNDIRHYTINLLAASTGMRMGECQGLRIQDVFSDHVKVARSWARKYGLKDPKWNSSRIIPVPAKTSIYLQKVVNQLDNQEADDFVFQGLKKQSPTRNEQVLGKFYAALQNIGIDQEARKTRNITFHSWRHWFNTICRTNGVADAKLRRVTGHKTEAMTELYSHYRLEDFQDVRAVQEEVFASTDISKPLHPQKKESKLLEPTNNQSLLPPPVPWGYQKKQMPVIKSERDDGILISHPAFSRLRWISFIDPLTRGTLRDLRILRAANNDFLLSHPLFPRPLRVKRSSRQTNSTLTCPLESGLRKSEDPVLIRPVKGLRYELPWDFPRLEGAFKLSSEQHARDYLSDLMDLAKQYYNLPSGYELKITVEKAVSAFSSGGLEALESHRKALDLLGRSLVGELHVYVIRAEAGEKSVYKYGILAAAKKKWSERPSIKTYKALMLQLNKEEKVLAEDGELYEVWYDSDDNKLYQARVNKTENGSLERVRGTTSGITEATFCNDYAPRAKPIHQAAEKKNKKSLQYQSR